MRSLLQEIPPGIQSIFLGDKQGLQPNEQAWNAHEWTTKRLKKLVEYNRCDEDSTIEETQLQAAAAKV